MNRITEKFDENIALETVSIILKVTVLMAVVTTILALATVISNKNTMSYKPKYAKTMQEIKLEEEQSLATEKLFGQ